MSRRRRILISGDQLPEILYLYLPGDKCTAVTGGYTFNPGSNSIQIDNAECLGGYTEAVRSISYWNTQNAINVEGYSKLVIDFDWALQAAGNPSDTGTFSIYDMLTSRTISSRSLSPSGKQWASERVTLEIDISQMASIKPRIGYDGNTTYMKSPHNWHMYTLYLKK